jgi:putative transposase
MPRPPRVHVSGEMCHAILRGNHRNAIFHAPEDRNEFEDILGQALERFRSRILACCWTTNHIHAIVRVADRPLGNLVQLVASRYARRFQRRIPTTSHLFERRYRARLITDTDYLLQAVRYIHLDPVEAGMVQDPVAYPWSSHRCYLGAPAPAWLSVDPALRRFGGSRREAVAACLAYLGARPRECPVGEWVDGARREAADGAAVPGSAGARPAPAPGLGALLTEIAGRFDVSPADIRSANRIRSLSAPRAALAQAALDSGAATLSEIATFLGRAPSTVSWLLQRYRTPLEPPSR